MDLPICNKDSIVHPIDIISDIELTPDGFTYKGEHVPRFVTKSIIASGGYGTVKHVTLYGPNNEEYHIAVKKIIDDVNQELSVVEKFYPCILECDKIITVKAYGNMVLMPLGNGDLKGIKFTDKQADNILGILKDQLQCLENCGAYYFDLKPDNIMYRCHTNGSTEIYLIDLGSIIPDEDGDYTSTLPPLSCYNGFINESYTKDAKDINEFQLAIMYILLIKGTVIKLYSQTPDDYLETLHGLIESVSTDTSPLTQKYIRIIKNHLPGTMTWV